MIFNGRRSFLNPRAICWISAALMEAAAAASFAQAPYEIVRGRNEPMCVELARNLNEFRKEQPMVCGRKFDPKYTNFSVPRWMPLEGDSAMQAALALERARLGMGPKHMFETAMGHARKRIGDAAASGKLRAWQSRFDIAKSGEDVRVVMVSEGTCNTEDDYSHLGDPVIGVLLPDKFEVDPRFVSLNRTAGDVFFHRGIPYVAAWSGFPSATMDDRRGPSKRHQGYVLVMSTFWLPIPNAPERGGGQGGIYDVVCQIGYGRLDSKKEGKEFFRWPSRVNPQSPAPLRSRVGEAT